MLNFFHHLVLKVNTGSQITAVTPHPNILNTIPWLTRIWKVQFVFINLCWLSIFFIESNPKVICLFIHDHVLTGETVTQFQLCNIKMFNMDIISIEISILFAVIKRFQIMMDLWTVNTYFMHVVKVVSLTCLDFLCSLYVLSSIQAYWRNVNQLYWVVLHGWLNICSKHVAEYSVSWWCRRGVFSYDTGLFRWGSHRVNCWSTRLISCYLGANVWQVKWP